MSDTGVGKTFTALAVARSLGLRPLIVCPKSIRTPWTKAAEALDVPIIAATNIEKLKAGGTPWLSGRKNNFRWNIPKDTLLVWDEAQNAGGTNTANARAMSVLKAYPVPVLLLSATLADSPIKLGAPGYLLGLHRMVDHVQWCLNHGCYVNKWHKLSFYKGAQRLAHLEAIHRDIFPARGVRCRIQDLDIFPENQVIAECYDLEEYTDEINKIYEDLAEELKNPAKHPNPLTASLRARQRTELFRIPLLVEMAEGFLEEGKSVVVFLSFRDSFDRVVELLGRQVKVAGIFGGQSGSDRDRAIADFQSNEAPVIVVMIQAGSVGLSLHDVHGGHPRASILTPTFNAVELRQALGRIHRAGGKSKCIQRIIYAAGTVEEKACAAVRRKLSNIDMLNDNCLTEGIIEAETG